MLVTAPLTFDKRHTKTIRVNRSYRNECGLESDIRIRSVLSVSFSAAVLNRWCLSSLRIVRDKLYVRLYVEYILNNTRYISTIPF